MNRSRWQAVFLSVTLHVAIVAAGVFSVSWHSPMAMPAQLAIEATVVDASILDNIDDSKLEAEFEAQVEAERLRDEAMQREQQEQQAREEAERAQAIEEVRKEEEKLEQARLAEQKRIAQERAAEQAEQKRIADEKAAIEQAERERIAKQQQLEREAAQRKEQERLAELKRQKEAEQKRLADEKRQREEAEARRKREAEQRRQAEAEALFLAQLEEEERRLSAAKSGLRDQYALLIKQKIERNWLRPDGAATGLECEVSVTQLPSREVVDVRVGKCNGDAAAVRSIENAVYKASPLPAPPDPALFERRLTIIFRPDA